MDSDEMIARAAVEAEAEAEAEAKDDSTSSDEPVADIEELK